MKGIILKASLMHAALLLSIATNVSAYSLQDGKDMVIGYYNSAKPAVLNKYEACKPVVVETAKKSMDTAKNLFDRYKVYDSQHSWIMAKISAAVIASYLVYKGAKYFFRKKVTFSDVAPTIQERAVKILPGGVKVMPSGFAHPTNRDPKKQNPKLAAFMATLKK
jgi:hypothetical protein